MKLYQITQRYQNVTDLIQDAETFEQVKDTLDALDEDLKDKLDSIGRIRLNYLAEAQMLKEEADRLKERADRAKREAEKLEQYVEYVMNQSKMDKIDTPLFKFSFRKSTSLVVTDISQLPEHFLQPQPPKADVAGLKKHLKQVYEEKGLEVPEDLPELGVQFVHKRNLQIK